MASAVASCLLVLFLFMSVVFFVAQQGEMMLRISTAGVGVAFLSPSAQGTGSTAIQGGGARTRVSSDGGVGEDGSLDLEGARTESEQKYAEPPRQPEELWRDSAGATTTADGGQDPTPRWAPSKSSLMRAGRSPSRLRERLIKSGFGHQRRRRRNRSPRAWEIARWPLGTSEDPFWARGCQVNWKRDRPTRKQGGYLVQGLQSCGTFGGVSNQSWTLGKTLMDSRRNHDSVIINKTKLVNVFGRYAESVEVLDLVTGESEIVQAGGERLPDGNTLGNFNHVSSVVVDSLTRPGHKEIWTPCGFHGHDVGEEVAGQWAKVVETDTLRARAGPRLPSKGGACAALALPVGGRGRPDHVCTFGGTAGSHDEGPFLDQVACYDRVNGVWNHPMGHLPTVGDHLNAIVVPEGRCSAGDPPRVLLMNFRRVPWGEQRPEIFAFDLPRGGEGFGLLNRTGSDGWYLFYNISEEQWDDPLLRSRDASGLVTAERGRYAVQFGGVHFHYPNQSGSSQELPARGRKKTHAYSMIRAFDVCERAWSQVGDMGVANFAVQTVSAAHLNVALTCGGRTAMRGAADHNFPYCTATSLSNMRFDDRHSVRMSA